MKRRDLEFETLVREALKGKKGSYSSVGPSLAYLVSAGRKTG